MRRGLLPSSRRSTRPVGASSGGPAGSGSRPTSSRVAVVVLLLWLRRLEAHQRAVLQRRRGPGPVPGHHHDRGEEHDPLHGDGVRRRGRPRRRHRPAPAVAGAGVPRLRAHVHRGAPRPAGARDHPADRVRRSRWPPASLARAAGPQRRRCARPRARRRRLHGRDPASRHRSGARGQSEASRSLRHDGDADDALGRHPAGVPHRDPAAHQRARPADQGHVAPRDPRRHPDLARSCSSSART